jgi:hypothetical protein
MNLRPSALAKATLKALRHTLRFRWLSRMPLISFARFWCERAHHRFPKSRRRPATVQLGLTLLEDRFAPNNLTGLPADFYQMDPPVAAALFRASPDGGIVQEDPPAIVSAEYSTAGQTLPSDDLLLATFSAWNQSARDNGGSNPEAPAAANQLDPFLSASLARLDLVLPDLLAGASPSHSRPPLSSQPPRSPAGSGGGRSPYTPKFGGGGTHGGGGGNNSNLTSPLLFDALTQGTTGNTPNVDLPGTPAGSTNSAAGRNNQGTTPNTDPTTATTSTTPTPTDPTPGTSDAATLAKDYGRAPLVFVPNAGQTDPGVQYLAQGAGFGLFLSDSGATFEVPVANRTQNGNGKGDAANSPSRDVFRMQLVGANQNPRVIAGNELNSTSNYFTKGAAYTDLPNYDSVTYKDVYPGVALVFQSTSSRQMEYQFVLAPGVDPAVIQQHWQGVDSESIDSAGNLVLHTPGGPVVVQAPQIYQDLNGVQTPVSGGWVLGPNRTTGFQVGPHDRSAPLVIDPSIAFSTYLGGSGQDEAYGVAVDGAGDAVVVGGTTSINFPTSTGVLQTGNTSGQEQAFLTKLNPNGDLLWSTYLGGNTSMAQANGVAIDAAGNAYVAGYTGGSGFPTTSGAY